MQDVPRNCRAPGSLNFKSNPPKRCEVYSAEEFRYPVTAFKEFKRINEIVEFHAESDLVGPAERKRVKSVLLLIIALKMPQHCQSQCGIR